MSTSTEIDRVIKGFYCIFLVLHLNNEWFVLQSESLLGLLSRYPFFNSSPLNKMATISQIIFPDVFS